MSSSARATVHDETAVRKRIDVEIPADEVQRELDRGFERVRQQAHIRGFRPGRAPRNVVEQTYGEQIRREVIAHLVEHSFHHAVEDHALAVVGSPEIDAGELFPGEPLRYTVLVDVRPEITLGNTAGIPAERPEPVVSDADVERTIEALRERAAELRPIGARAIVEVGDVVTVDLTSRLGEERQTRQGVLLEAGSGNFPLALERQLVGQRLGAQLALEVPYPADYGNASLAGKTVAFEVQVNELHTKELPALDDEFARDHGHGDTLAELRARVRADLEQQAAAHADAQVREAVLGVLLERHSFEVPASLVVRRSDTILASLGVRLPDGPAAEQTLARLREQVRPQAEREVRADLLLDALATREVIEITDADVEAEIVAMAARERQAPERLRAFYD
ncbi:MAG: trigger factor, partial [Candidatus Binatia bacterium]